MHKSELTLNFPMRIFVNDLLQFVLSEHCLHGQNQNPKNNQIDFNVTICSIQVSN